MYAVKQVSNPAITIIMAVKPSYVADVPDWLSSYVRAERLPLFASVSLTTIIDSEFPSGRTGGVQITLLPTAGWQPLPKSERLVQALEIAKRLMDHIHERNVMVTIGEETFHISCTEPTMNTGSGVLTDRAKLQSDIVKWLCKKHRCYNAPYGVLTGLHQNPRGSGKFRTVTFGKAGTLDAVLTIWSEKKLILSSSRDGGQPEEFTSVQDFYDYCEEHFE